MLALSESVISGSVTPVPVAAADEQLVLLGTAGGPQLDTDRSQPANLIVAGGKPYIFDCGEGCATQLLKAGFNPAEVEQAFLTHLHLDHSGGVGALAAFRWTGGASTKLTVFGPPGTGDFVDAALRYFSMPGSVHAREVASLREFDALVAGQDIVQADGKIFELFKDENVRVRAVENSHFDHLAGVDIGFGPLRSFSYRIDSAARSVVITGDTGQSKALQELASGADILVAEVMDVDGVIAAFRARGDIPEAQLPVIEAQMRAKHLTPEDVGDLARSAGVTKVALTHFAGAGQGAESVEKMVTAVQAVFHGEVFAGVDMQAF
tara:strand:+ start:8475 stop:9440 length:966 start_codon:yes stop_codon:yes gene_type:complete